MTNYYIDNNRFAKAIIDFIKEKEEDSTITLRTYEQGDYIGKCIIDICNNLANRANYINYTYKDEMIADAIENCIRAVNNFDYTKSSNAFGYFTQIATYAFWRRLQKEAKHREKIYGVMSSQKYMADMVGKQFDGAPAGSEHENNVQHFMDQIQTMLVENENLVVYSAPAPEELKIRKRKSVPNIAKFIKG